MSKIIDEIMDYVKSKNTDYAIMIDGKWGSGKTYFWTKELKPTIESTYFDQYNMYSTIYVSLYGLTSVEEINKKVFFELTQKMDKNINRYMQNRRIKDMSEFTKRGLDVANYYGLLSSSDKFVVYFDSSRALFHIAGTSPDILPRKGFFLRSGQAVRLHSQAKEDQMLYTQRYREDRSQPAP